ncbi:MAG: hypothetical protein H7Z40_15985 [Phycisphaerae bacterium]|nr:hypothetical protein [Gemmatimonadaceae bacterium]
MHLFRSARRCFTRVAISAPLLAVLAAFGGCVDGVDGPIIDDTGSITLALSNASAPIAVGLPAVSAVTVTRLDGYSGTILLSADSLPTGVTVTFEPQALGGQSTTAIMTITAATTAAVVTDTINVRASGVNVTTASATVEVKVLTGSIALTSPSTAVTIPQGSSGSIPLTVARINGFATAVTLLAEGLPANVTATFTPALLPNGTVGSTLILAAAAGAIPGTSAVVVRAKGQGVADKITTVQVTVSPSTTADFSLTAAPAAVSLVAGATGQTAITIGRAGGFAGSVNFAITGLPPGVTATFAPSAVTGNTTTLSVSATAAAVPGAYTIQLIATAAGLQQHTLPLVLFITPIPGVKVEVAPASLRIAPGGFAQAAVLLARVAGFTGDFVMTAEGLPAGLTASFSPAPVIGTATTLTLAATAATVPGTYNIVVKATAGSDFGTFTVPVTVATSALRQ